MNKTIEIEDLTSLIELAHKGNEKAIIEYASKILFYSNEIVSDNYLKKHIDEYALNMLTPLVDNGNKEAKSIVDDYYFSDNEYRE